VSGSTVYAGDFFTSNSAGCPAPRSRRPTPPTAPPPFSANDGVFSLAVSDSTVYAGGFFSSIAGQPRNRLAPLNFEGTVASFDPTGT
jgi:hypothetical protein